MRRKTVSLIILVFLGGSIMTLFSACSTNRKNSREFIEGRAAELSKVYPTKDLFELFDKFPRGFTLRAVTFFDRTNNASTTQEIILEGDSSTKDIKGTIVQERTEIDNDKKRTVIPHFKSDVSYTKEGFVFSNPEVTENNLRHKDFLLQKLTINKEILSKLKMTDKSYNWETGSASISYDLKDEVVKQFLSLNEDRDLKFQINMNENTISEKSFWYGLSFKREKTDYIENIGGK